MEKSHHLKFRTARIFPSDTSIFPSDHVSIEILPLSHGKMGLMEKFQMEFRLLTTPTFYDYYSLAYV